MELSYKDAILRLEAMAICRKGYDDGVVDKAIVMAIESIGKQIPKKVKYTFNNAYCPICGNNYSGTLSRGCKYCDNCGQSLDWGE